VKVLIIVTSVLVLAGCTDKNVFVSSEKETVQLQGTVQSWVCGTWDPGTYPPKPFVERTGEHPRLTIIYTDNATQTFTVNDSSKFSYAVTPGPCKIAVTTRFTDPADTFRFYFDNDTSIDLDIVMHILEPDSLAVLFWYSAVPDSSAIGSEWVKLKLFNEYLLGSLQTDGTLPRTEWRSLNTEYQIYSSWRIPVKDSTYNVLVVHSRAEEILVADTLYFDNMDVYPNGVYACELARGDSSTIESPIVGNR
jgi:hypothetical protein